MALGRNCALDALSLTALCFATQCTQTPSHPRPSITDIRPSSGQHTTSVLGTNASTDAGEDASAAAQPASGSRALSTAQIPDYLQAQRPTFAADSHWTIGGVSLTDSQFYARPWLWGQTFVSPTTMIPLTPPTRSRTLDDGDVESRARAIATEYLRFGRVDDELRWAPFLCRFPQPSSPTFGTDPSPHAHKLYFIYARSYVAYQRHQPDPLQVVVKESWVPQAAMQDTVVQNRYMAVSVQNTEGTFQPSVSAGLFMMFRANASTPPDQSEAGWVYATVSPSGAITAGRLASCVGCHRAAPHDGLFGLPQHRPHRL